MQNSKLSALSNVYAAAARIFFPKPLTLGLFCFLTAIAGSTKAQLYEPPAGYYSTATGTGSVLESQLHNIIDDHFEFSYNGARAVIEVIDRDPNNSNNIWLTYNQQSVSSSNYSLWNREHTWPRSKGIGSSGADNSDVHQLRPANFQVNSDRGNLHFGGAYGSLGGNFGPLNDGNGTVWYPGDWDAGHIARQQFYVQVRYDGSDGATNDLELANGTPSGNRLGDLARLIEWHFAAPVSEFERRRNDLIYDDYQRNRNPFIDHPEFAWSVFVDQANDSRIEVAGGTTNGNGGSTLNIQERAIFGNTSPITRSVTLNKSGLDGTYYSVETSGDVESSLTGNRNAFRSSQTDSTSFTVEIDGPGFGVGTTSGTVTINNLDITEQGGAGRGANDGDDVINVSYTALDHAQPSFASNSDSSSRSIDLGDFFVGSQYTPGTSIELFNRESFVGAELTANLDLDAILETDAGDKFSFSNDLFNDLAPNESRSFSFDGTSDEIGTFTAQYEFQVSDEDIAGEESSSLTLSLSFDVGAQRGDFSISGNIDDIDIDFYSGQLGQLVDAESELRELDLDADGMITLADHDLHVTTLVQTTAGGEGTLIGDLNLDGNVDVLSDAFAFVGNLGLSGTVGYADGDLNADGTVNVLGDGFRLVNNLGQSANGSASVATSSIPEPGCLVVSTLSFTGLCLRRRR